MLRPATAEERKALIDKISEKATDEELRTIAALLDNPVKRQIAMSYAKSSL